VETIKVSFGAAPKLGVEFRAAATSLMPSQRLAAPQRVLPVAADERTYAA